MALPKFSSPLPRPLRGGEISVDGRSLPFLEGVQGAGLALHLFPVLEPATMTNHTHAPSTSLEELLVDFLFYVRVATSAIEAVEV